jgi:hypothetical protein
MTADTTDHAEALAMLDAFASVGATRFDVTCTTLAGDKEWFRRDVDPAELARTLPAMLNSAAGHRRNVIVRPHGPGVTESTKAQANGERYAKLTARNAALAVERRSEHPRRQG